MKKGFTFVELAIVMVIIGIILSTVIKSAEIIDNAKAKRIVTQVVLLANAQNSFYERNFRYAGDIDNDGALDYTTLNAAFSAFDNTGSGNDIDSPFIELKNLGILSQETNATLASIAEGGPAYFAADTSTSSKILNAVIVRNVPCLAAYAMEINIDKNEPDTADSAGTGRVRGIGTSAIYTSTSGAAWTSSTAGLCSNPDNTTNIAYLFDKF